MVLPGRFELPFAASETAALSIELRELYVLELSASMAFGSMLKRGV